MYQTALDQGSRCLLALICMRFTTIPWATTVSTTSMRSNLLEVSTSPAALTMVKLRLLNCRDPSCFICLLRTWRSRVTDHLQQWCRVAEAQGGHHLCKSCHLGYWNCFHVHVFDCHPHYHTHTHTTHSPVVLFTCISATASWWLPCTTCPQQSLLSVSSQHLELSLLTVRSQI